MGRGSSEVKGAGEVIGGPTTSDGRWDAAGPPYWATREGASGVDATGDPITSRSRSLNASGREAANRSGTANSSKGTQKIGPARSGRHPPPRREARRP